MSLLTTLDGFFASRAPIEPGDGLVVAFSGGPDSSALLAALTQWSASTLETARGPRSRLALTAAHLDHALDRQSAERAMAAARIAARLGVPFVRGRRPVGALRRRGESVEATARRVRYDFLEQVRAARGARYVATGHHRDDQAETVVVRMLQGTGVHGLAGIAPRRGRLIRPLLDLPRTALAGWLEQQGLEPVDDATNQDLAHPRNRARHRLLPLLLGGAPELAADLARLAETAGRAREAIDRRMRTALAPRQRSGGVEIERRRLESLPVALRGPAVDLLHRAAGADHAPSAAARAELWRQLESAAGVGCAGGSGWTLASAGTRLVVRREPSPAAPFAYTLRVPGEVELPAGVGTLRLSRRTAESWMFEPAARRAGLFLELNAGDRITVRSRRPGDRIRPFGCSYDRLLKDVLIDRKVPRRERERLPLLCAGRRVLWVPGVTIAEECRLARGETAWVAEWEAR